MYIGFAVLFSVIWCVFVKNIFMRVRFSTFLIFCHLLEISGFAGKIQIFKAAIEKITGDCYLNAWK